MYSEKNKDTGYNIEEISRLRQWMEAEGYRITYYHLINIAEFNFRPDIARNTSIELTPEYLADTQRMMDDMQSRLTNMTLRYDDDETYWDAREVVGDYFCYQILNCDDELHAITLEAEAEVLQQVRAHLDKMTAPLSGAHAEMPQEVEKAYRDIDVLCGSRSCTSAHLIGTPNGTLSYPDDYVRLLRELVVLIIKGLKRAELQDAEPSRRRLIGNQLAILRDVAESEEEPDEQVPNIAICAACRTLWDAIGVNYEGINTADQEHYDGMLSLWRALAGVAHQGAPGK